MKTLKTMAREKWNGLLLIAVSVWLWQYSGSFPELPEGHPGPALFPRIMSLGLGISGLLFLILPWPAAHKSPEKDRESETSWLRLGGGIGILILFPILSPHLGFKVTLGLVCLSFGLLFKLKPWLAGVAALGAVLFVYLTFSKLLGVSL